MARSQTIQADDIMHVRTSERRTSKRCWQKWEWSYPDGLVTKEPGHALWFGSGIHESLAEYYQPGKKRGMSYVEVWEDFCDNGSRDGEYSPASELGPRFEESKDLGIAMLRGYHEKWGGDPTWDIIQPEMSFQVRIPFDPPEWYRQACKDKGIHIPEFIEYDGTFDGVYRDTRDRRVKLLENKTAKAIATHTTHLILDDQGGSYWAVAYTVLRNKGILPPKVNIAGIQYNYLRKALPDTRPRNADGYATNLPKKEHYVKYAEGLDGFNAKMTLADMKAWAEKQGITVYGDVSSSQPTALFDRPDYIRRSPKERAAQIQKIKDEALQIHSIQNGLMPVTKNPTADCHWECSFFEMCGLHDQGADWMEFRDAVFVTRDPYADHRKSA